MKMTGANWKNKSGRSKAKKLKKKKNGKNKEMLKKEGNKTSMNGDVKIMEVTETQNTGKNNEKKQNEEESVATEMSRNKTQMKNENEKQWEAKMEQENKDNTEGVGEQAESKSGGRKMTRVKKNQENANQGENASTGKRKREPEDNKAVPVSKKKQINFTQKDKCTLFIRFPESLVVKKQSHVKTIVGINVVNIRFPNVPRGTSKGFCYVELESEKDAKTIKEKLEKKEVDEGSFHVECLAEKLKTEGAHTSKTVNPLSLYVGRLPKSVNEEELRDVFPTAVKIKRGKTKSKFRNSSAYITFKTVEEAQKALEASKGLKVGDSEILVLHATIRNKINKVKKEKKNDNELPTPPAKKTKVEDVEMAM